MGKTRLANEVVAAVQDRFRSGVWFVGLADVSNPAVVVQVIAEAMCRYEPLMAHATSVPRERLAASIGDEQMLVMLDNCEHLRDECAATVTYLVERCPQLVVLTTSRERLGVTGERTIELGSLDLPAGVDRAAVLDSSAGTLFVERARDVHPGFAVTTANASSVVDLCRRLAGLPLALELAAARMRVLSPEELFDRLDGSFTVLAATRGVSEHHETLSATLSWSYDLLDDDERGLFRRLAVFRGGFRLAGAEAVGAVLPTNRVVHVLAALVDKSLVVATDHQFGKRFHLLEVVREFADALLLEHGEQDDAHRRHRDHLRELCADSSAGGRGTSINRGSR